MESSFTQYFGTNYIPTDPEIKYIRTHLVPYEEELARLEPLIQDLTRQRDRVKNYIDPHKALISHPRRLPHDILEQIFLACCPIHGNVIMSPDEPPLLLGRICRDWRVVSLSMRALWKSMH
ncbi:hypothetical protein C8R44DRAFT_539729, partial [Mycena epipterygia]